MHAASLLLSLLPVAMAQYGGGSGGGSTTAGSSTAASSTKSASSTAAAAAASQSGVHDINVGQGGFIFSPNSITAALGDTVNFHFFAGDHSVAQSAFQNPCVPINTSTPIYSGFIQPSGTQTQASQMFSITINNTNPIWLYCSQITHCQSGMAMVINPPSGSNTLTAYQNAAKGVANSVSPPSVAGGVVAANVQGASSSASGSASGSSSSTASASAASSSSSGAGWAGKDISGAAGMAAAAGGAFAWLLM